MEFWKQIWVDNKTFFHASVVNRFLAAHVELLKVKPGGRIFVPLCGKSLDLPWLLSQGFKVVGCELSLIAVQQLFQEMNITPIQTQVGKLQQFSCPGLDILQGDFFDITRDTLGSVDAIYDRAAIVALPLEMRQKYSAHMIDITQGKPQLLICFEYDQAKKEGPPFVVSADEVRSHYGRTHDIQQIASEALPNGLRDQVPATETVYLLTSK